MRWRRFVMVVILFVSMFAGCSYVAYEDIDFDVAYTEERYQEQVEQNKVYENDAYDAFDEKSSSVYYDTFDRLTSVDNVTESNGPLSEQVFRSAYQVYSTIRSLAPMLFMGSVGIGLLLVIFSKHNKAIRKVGLYGFIIAIPLFLVVFIFGGGLVMDLFLF